MCIYNIMQDQVCMFYGNIRPYAYTICSGVCLSVCGSVYVCGGMCVGHFNVSACFTASN